MFRIDNKKKVACGKKWLQSFLVFQTAINAVVREKTQFKVNQWRKEKRVFSQACSINLSLKINKNSSLKKRTIKPSKTKKMIERKYKYLIMRTTIRMWTSIFQLQDQENCNNKRNKMTQIFLLLTEKYRVSIKSLLASKNSTSCNKEKIRPRCRL